MERRTFTVPGPPQGKARARTVTHGGRTHSYTPAKTAQYERRVADEYLSHYAGQQPLEGPLGLSINAYYAVPRSWPKKLRQEALSELIHPTVKPDADNILKAVADALNGVAYLDDKQITEAVVLKKYGIEPRVEVELWQL